MNSRILDFFINSFLFVLAFLSIANINLYKNISGADVLIVFYVSVALIFHHVQISKTTFQFIGFGNLAILLSAIFIVFSSHIEDSVFYLAQFWIIVTVLPLFFETLIYQKKLYSFAKYYLFSFIIISSGLLLFGILYFKGQVHTFWIYHLVGLHRISFGDTLVSNDLGIIMATGFFLIVHFVKNKPLKIFLLALFSVAYFLTLSKSILLITLLFWLFFFRKRVFTLLAIAGVLFLFLLPHFSSIQRIDRLVLVEADGGGRMVKMSEAFESPEVVFVPLHGQENNMIVNFHHGVQSIHNFILNLFVNLGFFPAFIILFPLGILFFFYFFRKQKSFTLKMMLFTLFLHGIILSLNAFMLTRAVWIAIYLVVFYFRFVQKENYFFDEGTSSN